MSKQKLELHTNKKGDIAEECETTQWKKKKNRGMSRHEALSMPMWRTSRHLQIPGRKEVCAESAIMEGKPQGFPLSKF